MKIRDLNKILTKKNKALTNMGGYDEQTFIGASATSTHGSGISHGPLCDMIVSLNIVAGDGQVYRIEPTNGITLKNKFKRKYPKIKLVQDNDWFYSTIVSIGCLGIISSVIIKIRNAFYLEENRT